MNAKINGILIGIFFIFLGFIFLFRKDINFDIGYFVVAFIGIELLCAHIFTDGLLMLIIGSFCASIGILRLLPYSEVGQALLGARYFIALSIIFLSLFARHGKRGNFVGLFLSLLLTADLIFTYYSGVDVIGTVLICIGAAIILYYLLKGEYFYTATLNLGIVFIVLGVLKLIKFSLVLNLILPTILIWIGIMFFIRAIGSDQNG